MAKVRPDDVAEIVQTQRELRKSLETYGLSASVTDAMLYLLLRELRGKPRGSARHPIGDTPHAAGSNSEVGISPVSAP